MPCRVTSKACLFDLLTVDSLDLSTNVNGLTRLYLEYKLLSILE
jgi:hypothetical protein